MNRSIEKWKVFTANKNSLSNIPLQVLYVSFTLRNLQELRTNFHFCYPGRGANVPCQNSSEIQNVLEFEKDSTVFCHIFVLRKYGTRRVSSSQMTFFSI